MYRILGILLLFSTTLCYGQGKYTVRKTYQYEGDNSDSAKLVLTEKYNKYGKVVYARYKDYTTWNIDEYYYDGDGKTYYTYKDSLLTEELTIHKGWHIDIYNRFIENKTFHQGDTIKLTYDYRFDLRGRLVYQKEIQKEKQIDRTTCGLGGEKLRREMYIEDSIRVDTDIVYRKERQQSINEFNNHLINRDWSITDTIENEYFYDDCGIATKRETRGIYSKDKCLYIYDYDIPGCKLKRLSRFNMAFHCTTPDCTTPHISVSKIEFYQYSNDTIKKYTTYSRYVDDITFHGDTVAAMPIDCQVYVYNKQQQMTYKGNVLGGCHFHYDRYGRLIKSKCMNNDSKLTTRYTYE